MSQQQWPERFAQLKKEITTGREQQLTDSWARLLDVLKDRTVQFIQAGPSFIPEVNFAELPTLSAERIAEIKRKGCIVIHGVVPETKALEWKNQLKAIVNDNPKLEGTPLNDKQLFHLYWSRPQVAARGHAHVLSASAWLNGLFTSASAEYAIEKGPSPTVSAPLSYPDRFRIRKPGAAGSGWTLHPPHVDGGSIERWEDPNFRTVYKDILAGEWEKHDAFDMDGRINAQANLYDRPGQASVWRSFQGWLAMSETGPGEGTLRLYPDVQLANAYLILRPFFSPINPHGNLFDACNWKYDVSSPEFAGIHLLESGRYWGPRVTDAIHPNLRTGEAMVTIPKVAPGDMVFWHGDLIHSVEENHNGMSDSSVIYIAAVPSTEANIKNVKRQTEAFLVGAVPPDYAKDKSEKWVKGVATERDLITAEQRQAMCLPVGT